MGRVIVGLAVGPPFLVGGTVGAGIVGFGVGIEVGTDVGTEVGIDVGTEVGIDVGQYVGTLVGIGDGL